MLLFVLADLGGFLHQAAESHTRCAAHGELVHDTPPGRAPGEDDEHEGTHCKLCPGTWAPATQPPRGLELAVWAERAPGRVTPPALRRPRPRPLLRVAPKTSPPLS